MTAAPQRVNIRRITVGALGAYRRLRAYRGQRDPQGGALRSTSHSERSPSARSLTLREDDCRQALSSIRRKTFLITTTRSLGLPSVASKQACSPARLLQLLVMEPPDDDSRRDSKVVGELPNFVEAVDMP
jgi:hypothetical protein